MKKLNKIFRYLLPALLIAVLIVPLMPATPIMAASPETFYSTTGDGYLNKADIIGAGWAAVHDFATAGEAPNVAGDILYVRIGKDAVNYSCLRSGLYFDTSALPDDVAITSAVLKLYINSHSNSTTGTNFDLVVVDGSVLATPMVVADYGDLLAKTSSGGSISHDAMSNAAYNDIPLNTTGLALINKTGVTKLGLRLSVDIDNTTPVDVGADSVIVATAETANKPTLVIYYTSAIATNEATAVESTTATLHGTTSATSTMRGFEYAPKFTPGGLTFATVEAGSDRVQGTGTGLNISNQSVEVWFIPTATQINATIFATNVFGVTSGTEIKWDTQNNQLGFCYAASAALWRTGCFIDAGLVVDQLTHLVFTFDGGYIKVYINGVLKDGSYTLWDNYDQGEQIWADTIDSSDYPTIYYGSSTGWALGAENGGKNTAHAKFYTTRMYNDALTAAEVLSNYNDSVTTSSLIAEWEFNEASGTVVADSVGSYTGTITNPGSGISWGKYADWTEAEGVAGAYSHGVTSLTAGTNYHFRAKATIAGTTGYGADKTFTTTGVPTVQTNPAVSVGTTSATLQGTLTSLGAESIVYCSFEYGTTVAYGTTTADQTKTAIGSFSADRSGLTSNTLYHFRARARYDSTYVYGTDQTFTTQEITVTPGVPVNFKVSSSTETSLTLSWTKGADATNTVVRYATTGYPTLPTGGAATYSGTGITTTHTALTPDTRYYYSAWSETGGTYSATYATTSGIPTTDILPVPDTFEIETVQIYKDYINAGDNIIVFSYKILWNEGLPATLNPEDFFYIQVLDGSTVIKQDRIKQWGYVPGSLYVSYLSPLEWNKAYTFKIVGTGKFTTPPSVTYSITSSNYIGGNYDNLVTWVLDMATRMQNSVYWDTLIEYDVTGIMLNSQGSQVFTRAIPGILDRCPSLFYPAGDAPDYTPPGEDLPKAESFVEGAEAAHGTTYWATFENIALFFDVETSQIALGFWLILALLVIIGVTFVTGDLAIGAICAIIPVLIGARFGGIPMEYVTAAGILGGILFVYKWVFQHA